MGYEIKRAKGDGYSYPFFMWTEGMTSTLEHTERFKKQLVWLKTASFTFYPNTKPEPLTDYEKKWGGRLNMAQSEQDIEANLAGERFWEEIEQQSELGTVAGFTFRICDYVRKEWEE